MFDECISAVDLKHRGQHSGQDRCPASARLLNPAFTHRLSQGIANDLRRRKYAGCVNVTWSPRVVDTSNMASFSSTVYQKSHRKVQQAHGFAGV